MLPQYVTDVSAPGGILQAPASNINALSLREKFTRRARLLPATAVHTWKVSSAPFKILFLATLAVSVLLIFSEIKVRDLRRLSIEGGPGTTLSSMRTRKCTTADPCYIELVADLDTRSLIEGPKPLYHSQMLMGKLTMDDPKNPKLTWDNNKEPVKIVGRLAEEGRGMELSELVNWQNQMLSFDDRTGIIYELIVTDENGKSPKSLMSYLAKNSALGAGQIVTPVPRYILTEEQDSGKGMKIEWACEKDGSLYVGSFGKEYTTRDGSKITGEANFWIARLSDTGYGTEIERVNWKSQYTRLREIAGASYPGYLIHEAVNWSSKKNRWFFLPRRVSSESYDDKKDEQRGSNMIISIDAEFQKYDIIRVQFTEQVPARGFSSFKFVPGTDDNLILAIRSEEDDSAGILKTYISIFETDTGKMVLPEQEASKEFKFEGIEIW